MLLDIKGQSVIIDDEDYNLIKDYKWEISRNRNHFYVVSRKQINKVRTTIYMHRLIMDTPEGMFTDHINGNTLDNRKENLRVCTNAQNIRNQKIQSRPKSSKYKGVVKHTVKGRTYWMARCKLNGKFYTKYCKSEKEAAIAYNELAKELHGVYANINIVGD